MEQKKVDFFSPSTFEKEQLYLEPKIHLIELFMQWSLFGEWLIFSYK